MPSAKRKHGIAGADFPHGKNLRTVQEIPLLRTFRGTYPRFVQLGFSLVAIYVCYMLFIRLHMSYANSCVTSSAILKLKLQLYPEVVWYTKDSRCDVVNNSWVE